MRRHLRLRDATRDERGFTITEVTLTLLILSVVMLVAFDFLDRTSVLTFRADAHGRAEHETQTAMRVVTEHVRGAFPIEDPCTSTTETTAPPAPQGALPTGYRNCLRFTVQRPTVGLDTCAKSEFLFALVSVTGSTTKYLVENRRDTTGTTGSCTTGAWRPRRVLLENVANDDTQPLFTYYAADGSTIDPTITTAVKQASSVKVTLANKFRKSADALVLTGTAALRNNITR